MIIIIMITILETVVSVDDCTHIHTHSHGRACALTQ